jgi:hypothetical protein
MSMPLSGPLFAALMSAQSATVPPAPAQQPAQRRSPGLRYVLAADPRNVTTADIAKAEGAWKHEGVLAKSVLNMLNGTDDSIERLAFERDPTRVTEFAGIYRPKVQLIPDSLLKRMAIQDDLVAAVVHTRSSHVSQFGRKQEDRHSKGFKLVVDETVLSKLGEEHKNKLQERVDRAEKLLLTCGHTEGWTNQDRCSFSEYLYMSARNAVVVGRLATEVIHVPDKSDPEKRRFHSFRPTDAGTIYYAAPYQEANAQLREQALALLAQMKNEKLQPEKFKADEYAWVQVIEGRPMQAFAPEEMLVHNFYPTTDIELQGYPLTPMDTAISAITTHINITTHNKMYFQSGRAARGMLVIKSTDVDVEVVQAVKQQFNADINGVNNAWRMPVFGIGPEDELTWQAIDSGGRDMEFQFLADSNARTILAAFQMSPEELPGYQHLTRGTNNQALSESNEEYKLTAARDVGIRPMLAKVEDFLNTDIFPLIDPELAKVCKIKLVGLDLDTEEKESVRLSQDMPLHMVYDEVLQKVEKKPLGAGLTGAIPLNPTVWQNVQMMMTFGEIQERFMGIKDASKDASKQFYMNPFWFQFQEMKMQEAQAQQQAQQPQPAPGGGGDSGGGERPPAENGAEQGGDLSSGIDQALQVLGQNGSLSKSESNLPAAKRKLKQRIAQTNRLIMAEWRAEQTKLVQDIAAIAAQHAPAKA